MLRRRRFWIPLAALMVFTVVAVLTARPGEITIYPAKADPVTVYVINNGFHTDIAVPAGVLTSRGGPLAAAAFEIPARPWIVIGWGDASFYTAKGVSVARVIDGLRALFKPGNAAVLRFYGLERDPAVAYAEPGVATPVAVSRAGLDRMLGRIETSMNLEARAPKRSPIRTTPGEIFYLSNEHFSILRLCNHWTADMLSAAGLPVTPMIDGLAPTLMADLAWRAGIRTPR